MNVFWLLGDERWLWINFNKEFVWIQVAKVINDIAYKFMKMFEK